MPLQECLQAMAKECAFAKTVIDRLTSLTPKPQSQQSFKACDLLLACADHIALTGEEMFRLGEKLTDTKTMAIEKLDLSRSFWGGVLGFLVAVYVPLSFIAVSCFPRPQLGEADPANCNVVIVWNEYILITTAERVLEQCYNIHHAH